MTRHPPDSRAAGRTDAWPRRAARRHKLSAEPKVIYGRRPVLETLRAGRRQAFRLYMPREPRPSSELDEILALAHAANVPVTSADRAHMEEIAGSVNHQGVALDASPYPYEPFENLLKRVSAAREPPLVLLLDHLEDPQNVGSLLRTAEAVAADGVILPADRAVGVTPAVVRASAGASEHVRVSVVVNLARSMQALKDAGLWLAGLDTAEAAQPYTTADLKGPLGVAIGSEGGGLGRLVRENCDFLIRIPMRGRIASLNAGVAGALALYEVRRQRTAQVARPSPGAASAG